MRIFLDASILFSASSPTAPSVGCSSCCSRPGTSAGPTDTWRKKRAATAKAPGALAVLETLLARINVAGVQLPETVPEAALKLPEKDRPVLAAAMRLQCEALVTGDRSHFGAVYGKTLGGVTVHSPRSLAEMLLR